MTAVAGLFKPVNLEAMATSRIINGNSEKNGIKGKCLRPLHSLNHKKPSGGEME